MFFPALNLHYTEPIRLREFERTVNTIKQSAPAVVSQVCPSARRTDAAAEEFQRALDLNPTFAAHGYLGRALALDEMIQ
jgi:hypothetical protein